LHSIHKPASAWTHPPRCLDPSGVVRRSGLVSALTAVAPPSPPFSPAPPLRSARRSARLTGRKRNYGESSATSSSRSRDGSSHGFGRSNSSSRSGGYDRSDDADFEVPGDATPSSSSYSDDNEYDGYDRDSASDGSYGRGSGSEEDWRGGRVRGEGLLGGLPRHSRGRLEGNCHCAARTRRLLPQLHSDGRPPVTQLHSHTLTQRRPPSAGVAAAQPAHRASEVGSGWAGRNPTATPALPARTLAPNLQPVPSACHTDAHSLTGACSASRLSCAGTGPPNAAGERPMRRPTRPAAPLAASPSAHREMPRPPPTSATATASASTAPHRRRRRRRRAGAARAGGAWAAAAAGTNAARALRQRAAMLRRRTMTRARTGAGTALRPPRALWRR
jgi:hypothetical protein